MTELNNLDSKVKEDVKKLNNRYRRLNHLYKIQSRDQKIITMRLNKSQKELYNIEKENNNVLILKSRQMWISTYKLISLLDQAIFNKNQNCVLMAHTRPMMQKLFRIVKRAYGHLPDKITSNWQVLRTKPKPKYDNKNEYVFEELDSRIAVALKTRWQTITNLHITELAFTNKARKKWTAALDAVWKNPITVETTANGTWNFFYKLWNKHYWNENTSFKTVFFPWYDEPDFTIEDKYCDVELPLRLKKKFKDLDLSQEQRNRYAEQFDKKWEMVFQENPTTPNEAFLSSGRPFFNNNIIQDWPELDYVKDDKYPNIRYYNDIKETKDFLMGVDVCGWNKDGDYAVITLRNRDMELIATYMGHAGPIELARIIHHIRKQGFKTRSRTIWVERNSMGVATIDKLIEKWFWGLLFKYSQKKHWFATTQKSRWNILSNLRKAVSDKDIEQFDDRVKSQFTSFVYWDNDKPQAEDWSHDDGVMAEAICFHMRNIPAATKKNDWLIV